MEESKIFDLAKNALSEKKYDEAEEQLKQIIFFNPKNTEALKLLGLLYYELGNVDFAINLLERVIIINPDNDEIINLIGVILGRQNKHYEAEKYFNKALKINPNAKEYIKNLALSLTFQNKIEEAVDKYKRLLNEYPSDPVVYNDFGYLLQNVCLYKEAKECFQRAITLDKNFALAHWNLGLVLLREKDFENGFAEYEWGLLTEHRTRRKFSKPKWDGEFIDDKILLISCEQGFGDFIFFSRYLKYLIEMNIKFVLEVPKELFFLYKTVDGVENLVVMENNASEPKIYYDYYLPIASLPYVLKKFDTNNLPEPIKFEETKKIDDGTYKVGVCWKGSQLHRSDQYRSIPIEKFQNLFLANNVNIYALSKNITQEEGIFLYKNRINTEIQFANDFLATFYIISNLDLVITVDTAIAHLAGSMGKAVWLLLQYNSDWRWFNDTSFTSWYPNTKIYKQNVGDNWDNVIERVNSDFKKIFGGL